MKILTILVACVVGIGSVYAQTVHQLNPGTNVISDKLADSTVYEGDILELSEGTYIEQDALLTPSALTIRGAAGAEVIWYVAESVDAIYPTNDLKVQNIIFLTNTTTPWTFISDSLDATYNDNAAIANHTAEPNSIFIDHCQFIGFGHGILMHYSYDPQSNVPMDSLVVTNSLFYGGPRFKTYQGILTDYRNVRVLIVQNCTFWKIEGECIKVYGHNEAGMEEYFHALVEHNIFVDAGFPGLEQYGIGNRYTPTKNGVGVLLKYTSADDTVRNNIFYDIADFSIKFKEGLFLDTYMDYNTSDSSGWGCDVCQDWHSGHGDLGLYNVQGDGILLLADPDRGDFTLQAGSQAIGTASDGTDRGNPITDWTRAVEIAGPLAFNVNSTGDSGDSIPGDGISDDGTGNCTLRAAIEEANAYAGMDTIAFDIPGSGPHTIQPAFALPAITDPVIIDGYTQPGASPNSNPPGIGSNAVLKVELDGSLAGAEANGLYITAGNSTVRGLVINRFLRQGVRLEVNGGNVIEGNFIGTDVTGTVALGNFKGGVIVQGSPSNTIGGMTHNSRNIISGNGNVGKDGIRFQESGATGNRVQGNFIGTDVTGSLALGNYGFGVFINTAPGNTIGGTTAEVRNIISSNGKDGVRIQNSGDLAGNATENLVQGNYIGTDLTGTVDLGNIANGVHIFSAPGNTIGGTMEGERNIISGNGECGVKIKRSEASNNTVSGNYIGTDVTGIYPLGNDTTGVTIKDTASYNSVGGATTDAGNVFAFNGICGVLLDSTAGSGNAIERNSTFSNEGLGIDLGNDGPTPNDPGDGDTGPNNLQNFPEISSLEISGNGDLVIEYSVDSDPTNSNYPLTIQFFESDSSGQGKMLLGDDLYATTDFSIGTKLISLGNVSELGITIGDFIVATATDSSSNTSEFSSGKRRGNRAPAISEIENVIIAEDSSAIIVLTATDEDGDSLIYSATSDTNAITKQISADTLALTPLENWNGNALITVYVSDSELSDSTSFVFHVTPLNDRPSDFVLLRPLDGATIDITPENVDSTLIFGWEVAEDVEGDSVCYDCVITGTLADVMPAGDSLTTDSITCSYQAFVDSALALGDSVFTGTWTIFATDSINTTWASGEPFTLTIHVSGQLLAILTAKALPTEFALHQNYPNPFNPISTIQYDLSNATEISLVVYDLLGREVVRLVDGSLEPGYYQVVWQGRDATSRDMPSGVYIARLVTPNYTKSIKMLLLK